MADDAPQVEEEQTAGLAPDEGGGEDVQEQPADEQADEVAFSWQASEYVHHHKSAVWYLGLLSVVAVLVAATVLLHYWLEAGVIVLMGVATVVYASKPPRTLMYELTPQGVVIEGKRYPFGDFRSFGVLADEEWHSIDLEPAKRLRPRITMLFNTEDLDAIVGHLELHLPREDRQPDTIEQLTRYLRF